MTRLHLAALSVFFGVASLTATPLVAAAKTDLVLAIGGEPEQGYDPILGWGQYGHPLFQSTLLQRNADLDVVAGLATDWSLSDDRLIWTLTIREDARFSNGAVLTASDVAFTFNKAKDAGGVLDLDVLVGATAVDAHTVQIELKRPWITFVETLLTLGIVPEASYSDSYGRDPIGSGPFRFVSWVQGEQLIVEKNPYYYGATGDFERLVFMFTDEDASFAAASAGQVDIISVPAPLADRVPEGFAKLVVQSVDNRGISFPVRPVGEFDELGNPIGNAVTSDIAIRRAVNMGLDRETLIDVALFGNGSPAWGPADGLPWSNPEAALSYDPDGARNMLNAAGWVPGPDGVRAKDGVRASFPINYPASDSTRQALAMTAAELLRDIGIEAVATGVTWDTISRVSHAEPVMFGWGSHSPLEVYTLYHSERAGNGHQNVGYFSSEAVDAYFSAAQEAESLEESYQHWRAAEWDGETGYGPRGEAAWAWLVNLDHIYFVNECLDLGPRQIEPHGHGWPMTAGIENWRWTC